MNRVFFKVLLGGMILGCLGFVKSLPVLAFATASFGGMTFTPLFLDRGFMGRPVDLNFEEWGVRIQFESEDLPAPGVLTLLTREPSASSTLGYVTFGREAELIWTTNAPYAPTTTLLTLSDSACGENANKHCAIEETYRGETVLHRPEHPVNGSASALVRLGSKSRLVEVDGWMTRGDASWYAYKNCLCAASPDFPKGSKLLVTRKDQPEKQVVVTVNDWGPERDIFPERVIDLDKVAFSALASPRLGVIQVEVEPYVERETPSAQGSGGSLEESITEESDVVIEEREDIGDEVQDDDAGHGTVVGDQLEESEEVVEWEF